MMSDRTKAQFLSAAIAEQDCSIGDHHLRQIYLYYNKVKKGLEWPESVNMAWEFYIIICYNEMQDLKIKSANTQ